MSKKSSKRKGGMLLKQSTYGTLSTVSKNINSLLADVDDIPAISEGESGRQTFGGAEVDEDKFRQVFNSCTGNTIFL